MNAIHVALKDLRILSKDRGAVILLFVVPFLFIVIFSGILQGLGGAPEDPRIPLQVVDLDGGEVAQELLKGIDAAGGVRVVQDHSLEQAHELLDKGKILRLLIIPASFSADVTANRQTTLRLVNHDDADPEETEAVYLVIDGVVRDLTLEHQIVASLQRMGEMQANAPEDFQQFSEDRVVAQARSQFESSRTRPLVTVVQSVPGQDEGTELRLADYSGMAAPSFAVLFVFLSAQATAQSIHEEKKAGSFRRLLASPMRKSSLLLGKILLNLLLGLLQVAVIFAFGTVGMRLLGLPAATLGATPLAVIVVAVLIALCSSSLGILIAAIARTEAQITGLGSLILWGLGIISIIPPFIADRFLGPVPKLIPHYWANRAFDNLILRGTGWAGAGLAMLVLLGFSAAFFAIGLWRFDFD